MSTTNINYTSTSTKPIKKTVGDPNSAYESMRYNWDRARAVLNGQSSAKAYDAVLDIYTYKNLLLPFSPTMTPQQFAFYRAEAELPGLISQYAKILLAGLLRKPPVVKFKEEANIAEFGVPEEALEDIMRNMSYDGGGMISFLNEAVWEEVQSSRCWVLIDYPSVPEDYEGDPFPYAVPIKAENIINWRTTKSSTGKQELSRVIIRFFSEEYIDNDFHPNLVDTVHDYNLNEQGNLIIDVYKRIDDNQTLQVVNGVTKPEYTNISGIQSNWVKTDTFVPLRAGAPLNKIPIFPLNGNIQPVEPMLQPLIDREISLYNKVSRRNHLLYGAATYTPVVMSNMTDEEFEDIVSGGLGTWIRLRQDDKIQALETPTNSLKDMENAIKATVDDMARMGIRILAPEGSSGDSGVALEIRNSAQTAQLGLLNNKVSNTIRNILIFMINWKYNAELTSDDIEFTLSADFNPTPIGAEWLRIITEWYQSGIIPRSTFISIAKQNDILPADYNDEDGIQEITDDPLIDLSATRIDSSIVDSVPEERRTPPVNNNEDNNDNGRNDN